MIPIRLFAVLVFRDEDALDALHEALAFSEQPEVWLTVGEWEIRLRFVETHWRDMKNTLLLTRPEAVMDDRGDAWDKQDQEDLTAASLKYAATRYPGEDIV